MWYNESTLLYRAHTRPRLRITLTVQDRAITSAQLVQVTASFFSLPHYSTLSNTLLQLKPSILSMWLSYAI